MNSGWNIWYKEKRRVEEKFSSVLSDTWWGFSSHFFTILLSTQNVGCFGHVSFKYDKNSIQFLCNGYFIHNLDPLVYYEYLALYLYYIVLFLIAKEILY